MTSARTLVTPAFFERLVARVRADHGFHALLAERVVDQALAFLKACADNRGMPLSPSTPPKVDMVDTVAAIIASGYDVDIELWEGPGRCDTEKCHGCASGCHDDPPPIPPYRGA